MLSVCQPPREPSAVLVLALVQDAVVLVHPTCGPTQAEDIPGVVRYQTYEVLKEETADPKIR